MTALQAKVARSDQLATDDPILSAHGIAKSYGSVRALSDARLDVYRHEVLGIVGDNGAGKSTLLKILSGLIRPDKGKMTLGGAPVELMSTLDARRRGIATVYQDLALVEVLDIATNMFLGDVPRGRFLVQRKVMERETVRVMTEMGVRIGSVRTPVAQLSGGQRQIVAICRAVRLPNTSIILLDEPTAALGVRETGHVAEIIANLKKTGKAVVCVSHDVEFLLRHADRIHVMRLGRSVATRGVPNLSRDEVVGLITGATTAREEQARLALGRSARTQPDSGER
jgi:ABC-type sugar transport system ATPase subunit